MRDHIDTIWGWDESWQNNEFENGLLSYQTEIISMNDINIGYLQTEELKYSLYI